MRGRDCSLLVNAREVDAVTRVLVGAAMAAAVRVRKETGVSILQEENFIDHWLR